MSAPRRILIIAGPNGAGKTTFARVFLPEAAYLHIPFETGHPNDPTPTRNALEPATETGLKSATKMRLAGRLSHGQRGWTPTAPQAAAGPMRPFGPGIRALLRERSKRF